MESNNDQHTFLLPRPVWVNDFDVSYCYSCNDSFGTLKRRHHCRNCGNIFCHDCSLRKVPLPQLGYGTKPVRVCNNCFDVAYLVTYSTDQDHGIPTQIHGVRGLLELVEKDNEKDIHNIIAYGAIDALIWLCRSSKDIQLHHLSTTTLAMLSEKESVRPVIITKWGLQPLIRLIRYYIKEPTNDTIVLEVLINCTHIVYQLSRASILSQKEIMDDGVFDVVLTLASLHANDKNDHQLADRVVIIQSLAAKAISAISSLTSFQSSIIDLIKGTNRLSKLLHSPNDEVRKYVAKSYAFLSLRNDSYKPILLAGEGSRALVSIIALLPQYDMNDLEDEEDAENNNIKKYYLFMDSNDDDNEDNGLTDQINLNNTPAVSHACCAMANFATNKESQKKLMEQPFLLKYLCNVPAVFASQIELHRHVARCLANLALYEENCKAMISLPPSLHDDNHNTYYNILPTLLAIGQSANVTSDIQRHIIRAIDNLSSNVDTISSADNASLNWETLFHDAFLFAGRLLETSQDTDVIKRATNIITRRTEKEEEDDDEAELQEKEEEDETKLQEKEEVSLYQEQEQEQEEQL